MGGYPQALDPTLWWVTQLRNAGWMFACLTSAELSAAGLSSYQLRLAERCCVRRVRRGVYVVTAVCDDPAHRFIASVGAASGISLPKESAGSLKRNEDLRILVRSYVDDVPAGAVFSHQSALIVHGLSIPYFEDGAPTRVEFSHPEFGVQRSFVRVWKRPLEAKTEIVRGCRVTSLPQTLLDVSRDCPLAFSVAVVDEAIRRKLISAREFADYCARNPVRTRQGRIDAVAANVDARRESVAESITAVRFVEYSVPGFEPQVVILDENGEFVARTDFANPKAHVIAEFDGAGKYYLDGADPKQAFEHERRREYSLRNLGFQVFRITWKDLFKGDLFLRIKDSVKRRSAQTA